MQNINIYSANDEVMMASESVSDSAPPILSLIFSAISLVYSHSNTVPVNILVLRAIVLLKSINIVFIPIITLCFHVTTREMYSWDFSAEHLWFEPHCWML